MMGGASYMGGSQPGCHHRNHHYAHSHESYAAWGAGGNGAELVIAVHAVERVW